MPIDTSSSRKETIAWMLQIIQACALPLLYWGGSSLLSLREQSVIQNLAIATMASTITDLKSDIKDSTHSRYSSEQATTDRASVLNIVDRNTARIEAQAKEISDLREWKASMESRKP